MGTVLILFSLTNLDFFAIIERVKPGRNAYSYTRLKPSLHSCERTQGGDSQGQENEVSEMWGNES